MTVVLEYTAQLKRAASVGREEVQLPAQATLADAVAAALQRHDEEFRRLLVTADGGLQPTLLAFHCDRQIGPGANPALRDGDTLTFLSPISGG